MTMVLRLADGIRWKHYPDGVVVYVGETCETHLLPPSFGEFLGSLSPSDRAEAMPVKDLPAAPYADCDPCVLSDDVLRELASLKILSAES